MATSVAASRIVIGLPDIRRNGGEIRLTIPILNGGEVALSRLLITSITLGSAGLLSPPGWPIHLNTLGASNSATVAARFSDQGLVEGANLLLTVRGSYQVGDVSYGLTLTRFLKVPAPGVRPDYELLAAVQSAMTNGLWSYSIVNREPASSRQHIATFAIDIHAPVTVTGVPPGWAVDTDSLTYVLWYAADLAPPYPSHVAPGATLAGFQLAAAGGRSEVTGSSLVAWDHATDQSGRVFADHVLTPYRLT